MPWHGRSRSDPCPSYLVVQLFFLDMRKGNHRHKIIRFTTYCLLCSLVEHSNINPKSLAFNYLDEKLINTGLIKFLGLYPSTLYWYLEFASAFSTSLAPFRPMLFLYESKGSMTSRKSRLCGTMALPNPWLYYLLPCICVPSFVIGRSISVALWRSSDSTSFLFDTLLFG
ncbi:hypothetical protein GW17_00045181 [Ensete ventricosum]|nr:hypothetical protein GW17_00045181 [Ensete ventricosum]